MKTFKRLGTRLRSFSRLKSCERFWRLVLRQAHLSLETMPYIYKYIHIVSEFILTRHSPWGDVCSHANSDVHSHHTASSHSTHHHRGRYDSDTDSHHSNRRNHRNDNKRQRKQRRCQYSDSSSRASSEWVSYHCVRWCTVVTE